MAPTAGVVPGAQARLSAVRAWLPPSGPAGQSWELL